MASADSTRRGNLGKLKEREFPVIFTLQKRVSLISTKLASRRTSNVRPKFLSFQLSKASSRGFNNYLARRVHVTFIKFSRSINNRFTNDLLQSARPFKSAPGVD
jgi:hypothetical protein